MFYSYLKYSTVYWTTVYCRHVYFVSHFSNINASKLDHCVVQYVLYPCTSELCHTVQGVGGEREEVKFFVIWVYIKAWSFLVNKTNLKLKVLWLTIWSQLMGYFIVLWVLVCRWLCLSFSWLQKFIKTFL